MPYFMGFVHENVIFKSLKATQELILIKAVLEG